MSESKVDSWGELNEEPVPYSEPITGILPKISSKKVRADQTQSFERTSGPGPEIVVSAKPVALARVRIKTLSMLKALPPDAGDLVSPEEPKRVQRVFKRPKRDTGDHPSVRRAKVRSRQDTLMGITLERPSSPTASESSPSEPVEPQAIVVQAPSPVRLTWIQRLLQMLTHFLPFLR